MVSKSTKKAIIGLDKALGLICQIIALGITVGLILKGASYFPNNITDGISWITLGLVIHILVNMPSNKAR